MPQLKARVGDLESVPEGMRGLYIEDGDGFKLDPDMTYEGFMTSAEVDGLAKNKAEVLGELKALKDKFKDIDPKKYKQLVKDLEEKERTSQLKANDFESREKDLTDKFVMEREEHEEKVSQLRVALNTQLIDNKAKEYLIDAGAKRKGGITLLMPHVKSQSCVDENNGSHQVRIIDGDGKPRMSKKSGYQDFMTMKELIAEMRESEDFQVCFDAKGTTGSGAAGGGGTGGARAYTREQLRDRKTWLEAKKEADSRGDEILIRE